MGYGDQTYDNTTQDGDCGNRWVNTIMSCYEDHFTLADSIGLVNTPYFMERLEPLQESTFQGFSPRWYLPQTRLYADIEIEGKTERVFQTQTLGIIDTQNEIEIGIGYNWPPVVLGENQIQVQELLLEYLQKEVGDTIEFNFNGAHYFGGDDSENMRLLKGHAANFLNNAFADANADPETGTFHFQGKQMDLHDLINGDDDDGILDVTL